MKRLILIFILCLMSISPVFAQSELDDSLSYGESRTGEFTHENTTLTLGFEGVVGDVIYITVVEDEVPVEFTLLSPNGGQLAQSDNSAIQNIELGIDGLYGIELVRPEWSEDEGDFIVHLGYYTLETLVLEDEGLTLSYEGMLADAGALQPFQVDFEEGELITIFAYSTNSLITIQSPDGEYLLFEGAYDDPEVDLYHIPTAGTYTITVGTLEPDGTELAFELYKHEQRVITVNEPITGEINQDFPSVFVFETQAGKMWDINAVVPENGEGFLALYQFDERDYWATQIESDWGTGPDGQPRIQPFIPTEDGIYYVALWYDDWDTDDEIYEYELLVSPSTLLSLVNLSPLTGEINNSTGDTQYAYRGNAGDVIRINYNKVSGDGGLGIAMYSSEDEVVSFSGRTANSGNFEVELPMDGFYQVVIWNSAYDDETTLEYEIMIEALPK